MAMFFDNMCHFSSCERTYATLFELIYHIETVHIDFDPEVLRKKEESQPTSIPLSLCCRFCNETLLKEYAAMHSDVRRRLASIVKPSSVRSVTPTGSELDEEMPSAQSEDSNESWTVAEEFSSEYILRYGSSRSLANSGSNKECEKPFACPVPGCDKRYKNVNGIKYHSKKGHTKEGKIRKAYKCNCGKSYKTHQGLNTHKANHHYHSEPTSPAASLSRQSIKPISLPVMKALQGYVASSHNGNFQRQISDFSYLQKHPFGNYNISIPPLFETDDKPSQSSAYRAMSSHNSLLDHSVLPYSTCALTPAPSPMSTEKSIRLSRDAPSYMGIQMPLTPVTPTSESQTQFAPTP